MKYSVRLQHRSFQVEISGSAPAYELTIDGERVRVDAASLGDDSLLTLLLDGASLLAHTHAADARRGLYDVSIGGKSRRGEVRDELPSAAQKMQAESARGRLRLGAPLP